MFNLNAGTIGKQEMRSVRTEAFWQAFCRHEGITEARYEGTYFRTPPDVADRLLTMVQAGAMRATAGPIVMFGEGQEEPVPAPGEYAVLVDRQKRPRLIWRTTGVTVAPLSSVSDDFVWRSGHGTGEREHWLALMGGGFRRMAGLYRFDYHSEVGTMFETFEVVWPLGVARRIQLVAPHLDRGIALLRLLDEERRIAAGVEVILARIRTAVLTTGPTMKIAFTNPAAEALLRLGDGLRMKDGGLTVRQPSDEKTLAAAIYAASTRRDEARPSVVSQRPRGSGDLVTICRGESKPPYRVCVFPLQSGHTIAGSAASGRAVLFVDDPDEEAEPAQVDHYSRAFQLSPAEARLAVHLGSGGSLADAADVLGVTYNTVRAQLRAIFDKTDTHRQTELLRLLQTSRSLRISLS
jgi:uncharacterized protein YhfF/DNA-binding CsgD family transcriptional regulator